MDHTVRAGIRIYTCLAVRTADRVVVGVQPSARRNPFPDPGWRVKRWFAEPTKNMKTAAAWAAEDARAADAIAFPIAAPRPAREGGEDLLAAVRADPDDIAARLVYADWLLERGDVRGELIRLQCELAEVPLRDPRRAAMRAREVEVLARVTSAIAGDIDGIVEACELRRGLLEGITIRAPMLAPHLARLAAVHPLRRVRILVDNEKQFAQLGAVAALAGIAELELCGRPKPTGRRRRVEPASLAGTRIFAGARRLLLTDLAVDDGGWAPFLHALHAPRLRAFGLGECDAGPAELRWLATALPEATDISVEGAHLAGDVRLLSDLARRPHLHALALRMIHTDLAPLLRDLATDAAELAQLSLSYCTFGPAALDALLLLLAARPLARLALEGTDLTADVIATLLRTRELAHVAELAINPFPDRRDHPLYLSALLAAPPTTRIDWPWASRLRPDHLTQILAHLDLVRRRADGSVDLIAPA
ncbi:MAG: TIGR02996 domain-containing protein [Deltaproteobacteria bacterium]|nr:TIGR02996 domain-containing protein [Deltaproteobacteria bacterium]